jgi:hypothetical protein
MLPNVKNASVWNGGLLISDKGISGDFPIIQADFGETWV